MLKTLKLWFIIIFLPLLNILPKVSCTTIALSPRYDGEQLCKISFKFVEYFLKFAAYR